MEISNLSDNDLLDRLNILVRQEREDTAAIIAHLAEADRRDLARERGYSSLFEYCVKELRYSESSAYHRIRAARAVAKEPLLLTLLQTGELHLEAIVLLHPHLDDAKADDLVRQARGKTKREVEALLAPLSPRQKPHDTIRLIAVQAKPADDIPLLERAPTGRPVPDSNPVSPVTSEQVRSLPAAPGGRYAPGTAGKEVHPLPAAPMEQPQACLKISFSADPAFLELLEKARRLLWHKFPAGQLENIFAEALRALLKIRDPALWAIPAKRTQSAGRKIPKWIRRQVWKRYRGRCAYESADGRRCASRASLEFDHIIPWALRGSSNDPANVRLLCRAHNRLMARHEGLRRPELSSKGTSL